MSLPNAQINKFTANKITSFLNIFEISTKDPNTTKIPHRGYYIPFSFTRTFTPNTLHFLIITFSMIFYFSKKDLIQFKKITFTLLYLGFYFFRLCLFGLPNIIGYY